MFLNPIHSYNQCFFNTNKYVEPRIRFLQPACSYTGVRYLKFIAVQWNCNKFQILSLNN